MAEGPLERVAAWLEEARAAGVPAPEAAALATATVGGAPSVRMVLVKRIDARGLVFFTGYESRKGRELAANPRAALVLYWQPLGRQVRIEGAVSRLPRAESDAYFRTRPPASRLSAAASRQSEPIESRALLERRVEELRAAYGDDPPPPSSWGGFLLWPEAIELWTHHPDRLHERIHHRREGEGWRTEILQP